MVGRRAGWTIVAVMVIATAGCGGIAGEEGELAFYYEGDTWNTSDKKPIAVEARVELRAHVSQSGGEQTGSEEGASVWGDHESGEVDDQDGDGRGEALASMTVESTDPSVLEVEQVGEAANNSFELAAKSAGSATIEVEGSTEEGESFSDRVAFEAREATGVELEHGREYAEAPVYLAGREVSVGRTFQDGSTSLVGWGYRPFELSSESVEASLVRAEDARHALGIELGEETGELTIAPMIAGEALELKVADASDIDAVGLDRETSEPVTGAIDGDGAWLIPAYRIDGREVSTLEVDASVETQTPEVCEVSFASNDAFGELLYVEGHQPGECEFEVTVAEAGVSSAISVQLERG